jgi:formate dehydrogenase major subunit
LISGRFLYDEGAMVRRTRHLRGLQKKPFVEINDEDAKALDIADGEEVVVRANGTEARVTARIAEIVRGTVFVPYDLEGFRANALIPAGRVEVAKP